MLKTKRVYEARQNNDGTRILVDRLWPRGLSSKDARVDEWLKELSPSDELRRWFNHQTERWQEFRQRYLEELAASQQTGTLNRIAQMAIAGNVTLVYAAKDSEHNNAIVLKEFIADYFKALA